MTIPSLATLGHLTGIDRIRAIETAQSYLRGDAAYLAFERRYAITREVDARGHGGINSLAADLGIGRDKVSAAVNDYRRSVLGEVVVGDGHTVTYHTAISHMTPLACSCGWTGHTTVAPHDPRPVENVIALRVARDHLGRFPGDHTTVRLFAAQVAQRWGLRRQDVLQAVANGTFNPPPAGDDRLTPVPGGTTLVEPYWTLADIEAAEAAPPTA